MTTLDTPTPTAAAPATVTLPHVEEAREEAQHILDGARSVAEGAHNVLVFVGAIVEGAWVEGFTTALAEVARIVTPNPGGHGYSSDRARKAAGDSMSPEERTYSVNVETVLKALQRAAEKAGRVPTKRAPRPNDGTNTPAGKPQTAAAEPPVVQRVAPQQIISEKSETAPRAIGMWLSNDKVVNGLRFSDDAAAGVAEWLRDAEALSPESVALLMEACTSFITKHAAIEAPAAPVVEETPAA